MKQLCAFEAYWFETGHTTVCQLPPGHQGDHCDGVYWFDRHGVRTPPSKAGRKTVGMPAGRKQIPR
jgi:hypothetical protein